MGLIADEEPAIYKTLEAAGLTHGKGMQSYLCMMAVRLLEMRRVLKETGSIYIHCDPTASHYLKLVMDAVFGRANFRNEITWQRTESHNTVKFYGNIADIILFYTGSDGTTWNREFHKYSEQRYSDQFMKRFRYVDEDGRRYRADNLTAPRTGQRFGKVHVAGHYSRTNTRLGLQNRAIGKVVVGRQDPQEAGWYTKTRWVENLP